MPAVPQLIELLKEPSKAERTLIENAFAFAEEVHKSHARYSGEPYFNHLFETAKILAELGMDATTVAAGLLHDAIEDVGVTQETLRKEFGDEILMLVTGVTNLGHLHYRGIDRYSESLRRMFIASAKDVRVLIIKLADRLHNIRTLACVPEEKRARIAIETLEIYAPIAYRLGIRRINRELQERSFPFAHPNEYARVKTLIKGKESELTRKLLKFHKSVLKKLAEQKIAFIRATHRIKGLYSLYIKLKNKDWDLEKITDVLAIRIIVREIDDCYRILGAIHGVWRPLPRRIKDYIAFPKPNGYQSLHTTVFTGDGGIVEIQIRTEEMHR
ncbi:MAG: (P)ppGpp synthetase [Parcubacteria group bacterium Greene0416_79]|nr:MAG: (P)ppGpp synthetase [Parcubacteria group bacterium Greene0416_79]